MNLESERMGKIFQVFGIAWFLTAGLGQAAWDAIVAPHLLWAPVFCAGSAAYIWHLGRKDRRRARDHHEFMESHRRMMAAFDQQSKAM